MPYIPVDSARVEVGSLQGGSQKRRVEVGSEQRVTLLGHGTSKCAFFRQEVQYLGHVISREGVAADPRKIEKVANWPEPTSTREVQQFLGFASYYRRFIKDFAQIAKPLHRLTERGSSFRWNSECQIAFDMLRKLLTSAPVLVSE